MNRPLFFRILTLVILMGSTISVALAEPSEFTIKGSVIAGDSADVGNTPVTLMLIQMDQQPAKSEHQKTRTDVDGKYVFNISANDINRFFRVEIMVNGMVVGSEPFKISRDEFVKTVDIQIPETVAGLEFLNIRQEILIVDLLDNGVRITDIINIQNPNKGSVVVEPREFVKRLPPEYMNLRIFRSQALIETLPSNEGVGFQLSVPPGRQQIVFNYDLPVNRSSFEFENTVLPGTELFEVLTVKGQLSSVISTSSKSPMKITRQEKHLGDRQYVSQQIEVINSQKTYKVTVEGMPASPALLIFPAYILAVFLIVGFVYFIWRISRINRNNDIPQTA